MKGFAIFIGRKLTDEELEVYESHPEPETMRLDGYPVEPIATGELFVIQQKLKEGTSLKKLKKRHDKRYKLYTNHDVSCVHKWDIYTGPPIVEPQVYDPPPPVRYYYTCATCGEHLYKDKPLFKPHPPVPGVPMSQSIVVGPPPCQNLGTNSGSVIGIE